MKIAVVVSVLCAAICALTAVWFLSTFERVVVDMPAGFEGEARYNGFLAAELLLGAADIDADARATLTPTEWLPDPSDTLFVNATPGIAAATERAALLDWVTAGGHLVLSAPAASTVLIDELFRDFGFRLDEYRAPGAPRGFDEAGVIDESAAEFLIVPPRSSGRAGYSIAGQSTPYRLEPLVDTADIDVLRDEDGIFVARSFFGNGYVTAVADSSIFDNLSLEASDHARLLLDSLVGYVDPGTVWFVYDASFTPLWRLIWDNFRFGVIGFAALLAAWLWSVIPRFGPLTLPGSAQRRSILEHVRASARFHWRYDGAAALVEGAIAAVLHRAEIREPGIGRRPPAEQAASIARLTGLPADAVTAALDGASASRARDFTQRIQTLHALRNSL